MLPGFSVISFSTNIYKSFLSISLWGIVIQLLCLSVRFCWKPAVTVKRLPGIDEILGQADVSRGPCDGDLAL